MMLIDWDNAKKWPLEIEAEFNVYIERVEPLD